MLGFAIYRMTREDFTEKMTFDEIAEVREEGRELERTEQMQRSFR